MSRPIVRSNLQDTGHKCEAIGSWDHGVEPYDVGETDDPKVGTIKVR